MARSVSRRRISGFTSAIIEASEWARSDQARRGEKVRAEARYSFFRRGAHIKKAPRERTAGL